MFSKGVDVSTGAPYSPTHLKFSKRKVVNTLSVIDSFFYQVMNSPHGNPPFHPQKNLIKVYLEEGTIQQIVFIMKQHVSRNIRKKTSHGLSDYLVGRTLVID